jgi:Uma2 family endonuclease
MSMVAAQPRMTVEEFYQFCLRPENQGKRLELDEGEVVEMPSPGGPHGIVCGLVSRLLGNHLFDIGRGRLYSHDTGLVVSQSGTVRGPDVMIFLEPKSAEEAMTPGWVTEVPTLVVEVVSPSDRPNQIQKRLDQYRRRGVPLIWIVDPEDRTIAVHQPNEFSKVLTAADELTGNGVLPDFHCKVADLFRLPGQP